MAEAINIVLCIEGHQCGFVEIEDDNGAGVRIGEWTSDEEYTRIRITKDDIDMLVCSGE